MMIFWKKTWSLSHAQTVFYYQAPYSPLITGELPSFDGVKVSRQLDVFSSGPVCRPPVAVFTGEIWEHHPQIEVFLGKDEKNMEQHHIHVHRGLDFKVQQFATEFPTDVSSNEIGAQLLVVSNRRRKWEIVLIADGWLYISWLPWWVRRMSLGQSWMAILILWYFFCQRGYLPGS